MSDASTASDQTRPAPPAPRLLDRLRGEIRVRHYSLSTEVAYVDWCKRYIRFHGLRHPAEMGAVEATAFVTHLAVERRVSASTQNQALSALLFLYRHVLGARPPWLDEMVPAKRRRRLPVMLRPHTLSVSLQALSANAPWPCRHRRGS